MNNNLHYNALSKHLQIACWLHNCASDASVMRCTLVLWHFALSVLMFLFLWTVKSCAKIYYLHKILINCTRARGQGRWHAILYALRKTKKINEEVDDEDDDWNSVVGTIFSYHTLLCLCSMCISSLKDFREWLGWCYPWYRTFYLMSNLMVVFVFLRKCFSFAT